MAALMRFSRFTSVTKHVPKLTSLCNAAVPKVRFMHGRPKRVARTHGFVSSRRVTTDSAATESVVNLTKAEKLAQTLDGNVRRYGRVASNQLLAFVEEVEKEGRVSKQNSLFILQCCGAQLYNELPETRVKMTLELWDKIQQIGDFDVRHYNALLRAHLDNGYDFSPTKYLSDMEAQNISPNRVTYQRLIAQYCQQGDMGAATQILDHMKQADLPINEYVFKAFIKGHFKAGDPDSAKETLNIMRQAGLEPSGDTYSAVLSGYAEMGNYEAIKQSLLDAESEGVMLRPQHILDVIFSLAKSGHHEYIEQMIDLLNRGPAYSQTAIKYVTQLIAHGYDDIAYKLYLAMPKPTQMDKQESMSGRFFIRALVKFQRPLDKVNELVNDMKQRGYNKDDLSVVPIMAFVNNSLDYALKAIERMKSEGLPVRAHYFWPAICQYRDRKDAEGVVSSISKMWNLCDTHSDFMQALHGYGVPALFSLGMSMEDARARLLEIGFESDEINFAFFLSIMKHEGVDAALKFGEEVSMVVIAGGLRPAVVDAVQAGEPWEKVAQVLQLCDSKSGKILREVTGSFMYEVLKMNKRNPNWEAVGEIVDFFKLKEMQLPGHLIRDLQATKNLNGAPGHLIEKLESLQVAGGKFGSYVEQTNFAEMSQSDLKAVLERNADNKAAQKWLLIKCCQAGDVQQAEELNARLKDEGFVLPPIALRQLAFLYAYHANDLEQATHYLERLRTEFPDYSAFAKVLINMAGLLAERNKPDEALTMLKEHASQFKDTVQEFSTTYELENDCEKLVRRAALADPASGLTVLGSLFDLGYIRKPCYRCLEAYIDGVLQRENDEDLLTAVEQISQAYGRMPKLDEICRHFINKEDPDGLQKVVDQATPIFGEMNVLNQLVISFIACGHPKKARKIIEMPGFRAMMPRLIFGSDRFVFNGKVQELEQLVEHTKDVFAIDRDEMLFQLIRCYVKQQDMKKALNVLTMFEEENVRTSDRTLRYLAKVLEGQNMDVPFEVPKVPSQAVPEAANLSEFEQGLYDCIVANNKDAFRQKMEGCDQSSVRNIVQTLSSEEKYKELRIFYMLLGETGELEKLRKIESEKIFPQLTSFKLKAGIFMAHITSNMEDELMKYLEQNINQLPAYVSEEGVFLLGDKSPQYLAKLETLIFKLADERQRLVPVNILWSYYFINNSPKATEILQKYPDLVKRLHVIKVCREATEQKKPELLMSLCSILRVKNAKSLTFVHSFLMGYHSEQSDGEAILSVYQQLQTDQIEVADLNRQNVQKAEAILKAQNKAIPWATSRANPADSSDSSDSSDDERR